MPTRGPGHNRRTSRGLGEEVRSGREGEEAPGRHAGLSPERAEALELTEARELGAVSSRMDAVRAR